MFGGHYLDWNSKRAKAIIDSFGHQFFHGKKMLDLGSGHGDVGATFYRLGAEVICVDAREEHLKVAAKKFPGIKTFRADLDTTWGFNRCDIILDLGLINHLKDFRAHLASVCDTGNVVILEAAVCDSDDPDMIKLGKENKTIYDLSFNGVSSFPTAAAIERTLTDLKMNFRRLDNGKINSLNYVYDWTLTNTRKCNPNKRRMWIVQKQQEHSTQSPLQPIAHSISPIGPGILDRKAILLPNFIPAIADTERRLSATTPYHPTSSSVRTALCISGYLRTFDVNFDLLAKNILYPTNCDIFIHTWDTLGCFGRGFDTAMYYVKTEILRERIQKLFSPKKMVIENQIRFDIPVGMHQKGLGRDVNGVMSMFYKIESCNKLKKDFEQENNFTYDCVIRARADLCFEQTIDIKAGNSFNYLYVPKHGDFNGLNDQFAYGSSEIMDKYSSLYSNIHKYYGDGLVMDPEILTDYHVRRQMLPVLRPNLKYLIRRGDGSVQDNEMFEKRMGFRR